MQTRIGVLLPSVNVVFEPDLASLSPPGTTIHVKRMPIVGTGLACLEQMNNAVDELAGEFARESVDVVVYACTSGSFMGGAGFDQDLARRIAGIVDRPVVVTSSAVLEALDRLGLQRVCVATPYPDEVNERIPEFLRGNDIDVVDIGGRRLGVTDATEIGDDPPEVIERFALEHWRPNADGLFLSCTAWQAMSVVERLEHATGKPVVTSNQATIWQTFRVLGCDHEVIGAGRLFRDFYPLAA